MTNPAETEEARPRTESSTPPDETRAASPTPYIEIGPKGGKGRIAQVKAAVTMNERKLFYGALADRLESSLSDIIRSALINLAIEHELLPEDYDQSKGR